MGERALAPSGPGNSVGRLLAPPPTRMQQLLDPLWGRGRRNHIEGRPTWETSARAPTTRAARMEGQHRRRASCTCTTGRRGRARGGRPLRLPASRRGLRRELHLAAWTGCRDRRRADRVGRDVTRAQRAHDRGRLHQLPLRRGAGTASARPRRRRAYVPAAGAPAQTDDPTNALPRNQKSSPVAAFVSRAGRRSCPILRG